MGETIRRVTLPDTVQQRIERFIIASGARPGDPLPPQHELARRLHVSVPSIREAMKSLEALGMIEVRHGAGSYVGAFSLDAMADGLTFRVRLDGSDNTQMLFEMLDIRMILEQSYVRRVVHGTTPAHIAALYAVVAEMEAIALRGQDFPEEDWRFHELLYRPIASALLTKIVRAFWDVVEAVKGELTVANVPPLRTVSEHRDIVDAIAAGDADAAANAMELHFTGVRDRLMSSVQARAEETSFPD